MPRMILALALCVGPVVVGAQAPVYSDTLDVRDFAVSPPVALERIVAMPMLVNGVNVGGTWFDALHFPSQTTAGVEINKNLPLEAILSATPSIRFDLVWWKGSLPSASSSERLLLYARIRGERTSCSASWHANDFSHPLNVIKSVSFTLPFYCTSIGAGPNALWIQIMRGGGEALGHGDNYLLGATAVVLQ